MKLKESQQNIQTKDIKEKSLNIRNENNKQNAEKDKDHDELNTKIHLEEEKNEKAIGDQGFVKLL